MSKKIDPTFQSAKLTTFTGGIAEYLNEKREALETIAHKGVDVDKFVKWVAVAASENEKIAQCTSSSIYKCLLQAIDFGVSLNPAQQEAYLIPRKTKCTLLVDYKALIRLAIEARPDLESVSSRIVYAEETCEIDRGTANSIKHLAHIGGNRGEPVHVYVIFRYKSGSVQFDDMPYQEYLDWLAANKSVTMYRRNGSLVVNPDSPHVKSPKEMAKKMLIRRALKLIGARKGTSLQKVISHEDRADSGKVLDADIDTLEEIREEPQRQLVAAEVEESLPGGAGNGEAEVEVEVRRVEKQNSKGARKVRAEARI